MVAKYIESAEVQRIEHFGENYFRLTFLFPTLAETAHPGQFVSIALPGNVPQVLRRPFSLHRVQADGSIQILCKIVGAGTKQLSQVAVGSKLDVMGPLGDGIFNIAPNRSQVLLVAGGIGVAPLFFLADRLFERDKYKPILLFGGRSASDLPIYKDFTALNIPVHLATDDGSVGHHGFVTGLMLRYLENHDASDIQVHACGPIPMLKAVAKICREKNIECYVSLETMMACGTGSCYGCVIEVNGEDESTVNYERVCHEGPVFPLHRLPWDEK